MHRDQWLAILCVVLVVVLAPVIGRIVLGPVNRAAGRLHAPTKFLLPDFMWLLFQIQIVLWYCVQFVGIQQRPYFAIALSFLSVASLAMWGGAVSFLSRAGVRSNLRRGVFILILLPATLGLMMFAPILPVLSYLMQTDAELIGLIFRLKTPLPQNSGLAVLAGGMLAIPLLGLLLHRISRWMVAELAPPAYARLPIA